MARRYRRVDGGVSVFAVVLAIVLSLGILFGAVMLGVWKHKEIGNAFGMETETEVNEGISGNNGAHINGNVIEGGDLVFKRSYLRSAYDTTYGVAEYYISEDLSRKIVNSENLSVALLGVKYEDYDVLAKEGKEHVEIMNAIMAKKAEDSGLSEAEFFGNVFTNYKENNFVGQMELMDNGRYTEILRGLRAVEFGTLNERKIIMPVLMEKAGDEYKFTYSTFGEYEYDDLCVSPSIAYLASVMLNQMDFYTGSYDEEALHQIAVIAKKACAEAAGLTEGEYTEVSLALDTSEPLTMKVGETKKISVSFGYDVDFEASYWNEYARWSYVTSLGYESTYAGCYEMSLTGKVTALKAGTYAVCVVVFGHQNFFTLEVTE